MEREQQHHGALCEWCSLASTDLPELQRVVRVSSVGRGCRCEGVFLPAIRPYQDRLCAGLWIVFESQQGTLMHELLDWAMWLQNEGYACAICKRWEQARDMILEYLGAVPTHRGVLWLQ